MVRTEGEGMPQEVVVQGVDHPLNGKELFFHRALPLLLLRQIPAEVNHRPAEPIDLMG